MSTSIPENLNYTQEHEWTLINAGIATVGITDFAQSSLGDIVYLELPSVGQELKKGATFGVVESVKSVSDLYAPLSGKVIERNEELMASPDKINQGAYDAWMVKIKLENESELSELMNHQQYSTFCQSQH